MSSSERVVLQETQWGTLATISGSCPLCAAPALWAFSDQDCSQRVLLDPASGSPVVAPSGSTVVVASAAGRLSLVSAWVFRMHVCAPGVVTSAIGDYTEADLSHPCPIDSCLASPGELCISLRYEIFQYDELPRPHGARRALALGKPWSDEESVSFRSLE